MGCFKRLFLLCHKSNLRESEVSKFHKLSLTIISSDLYNKPFWKENNIILGKKINDYVCEVEFPNGWHIERKEYESPRALLCTATYYDQKENPKIECTYNLSFGNYTYTTKFIDDVNNEKEYDLIDIEKILGINQEDKKENNKIFETFV
jgi:hypothetical protein